MKSKRKRRSRNTPLECFYTFAISVQYFFGILLFCLWLLLLFCHIAHTSRWLPVFGFTSDIQLFPLIDCEAREKEWDCGGCWPYCFVLGDSPKQNYTHERHGNGKLDYNNRCQKRKLQRPKHSTTKKKEKRIIKTATKQTELKATPKSVAGVKETKKCSIACLNGKTKAAIST